MNKILPITILLCGGILAGCSNSNGLENAPKTGHAIVVYYSATNNTERIAQIIANHIGATLYELEPVNPYTSADLNYNNSSSRVVAEHNDPNRHVELVTTSFEEFAEADYVFLGFPVWWQEPSWVVNDFVSENDFTDKVIIPFGTSASSGFDDSNLEELAQEATWATEQRFRSRESEENVIEWVDSLRLTFE